MTRKFNVQLGVTQVGDGADIFAKVHQLMSTPEKGNEEQDNEKKDQLVADRVALYAMVRAGYAPDRIELMRFSWWTNLPAMSSVVSPSELQYARHLSSAAKPS